VKNALRVLAGWLGWLAGWLTHLARHKMMWMMIAGAVGTLARYGVGQWFKTHPALQGFPYGTLVINVTGSFLLALLAVVIANRLPLEDHDWYLMVLGTGLCGGYTTFSTFEWETFQLVRDGSWPLALVNIGASVVAGFVGVLLGVALAHRVFPQV
jgi:CrcB protein